MSDIATAPAPAEATPSLVPIEAPVSAPNPVHSEPIAKAEPEVAKKPPTIAEALSAAKAKVQAEGKLEIAPRDAKPVKAEPAPVAEKVETQRDPTGRFVPKAPDQQAPAAAIQPAQTAAQVPPATPSRHEVPARFSPDAKAAWETAPEPVRAEINRAIRELEQGHQKYKADAEAYEPLREFDAVARRNGGDLRQSLERVVGIDQAFQRNPLEGFQAVADHFGLSLRAVAAHIMGQTPDQQATQTDATIRQLHTKIAQLEQQVSGVTKSFETQRVEAAEQNVTAFAKDHPRFEELSDDIAFFLNTRTKDLAEAYSLAERLNPAPVQETTTIPAASTVAPALEAQTQKASKSVRGAPSAGSSPARKPSSSSVRESLSRAIAEVGAR